MSKAKPFFLSFGALSRQWSRIGELQVSLKQMKSDRSGLLKAKRQLRINIAYLEQETRPMVSSTLEAGKVCSHG